jgi:hypothetical protein
VQINQLKQFIDTFLKSIKNIDDIYSKIRAEIIPYNLKIILNLNKTNLTFENNQKKINILLEDDVIISIKVNEKEILDKNISTFELSPILYKLK